jgi:hypothetical protein
MAVHQCRTAGAGAARGRIILVKPDPEQRRSGADGSDSNHDVQQKK